MSFVTAPAALAVGTPCTGILGSNTFAARDDATWWVPNDESCTLYFVTVGGHLIRNCWVAQRHYRLRGYRFGGFRLRRLVVGPLQGWQLQYGQGAGIEFSGVTQITFPNLDDH
jgi:hypothetical protein